ncbi:MAG: PorP/SprF family type IX secretion system membrane protein [Bacteroidales bacterium]|nr:PorP/SprF family type IX secretion system membrane protein [Bacteroidales bacterium]
MRLTFIIFLLVNISANCLQAQSSAARNLYHTDPYFLNPAYAGIDDITQINASILQQWAGLEDAPALQILSGNGQINKGLGFGALIYNDKNGLNADRGANLSGTYFIEMGRSNKPDMVRRLSFGLGFTAFQHSINLNGLTDHEYDPLVDNGDKNDFGYKFNLGALLYFDNYVIGISALGLAESTLDIYNYDTEPIPKAIFNVEAGYIFNDIDNIKIIPSVVYSSINQNNYSQLDINTKGIVYLEDEINMWLNLSLRGAKESKHDTIS